jgi:hypothetical protein
MAKRGAPPEYNARIHCKVASAVMRMGKSRRELREILNIAESTLYKWQQQHEEFAEALRACAREADAQVEASLFQRAIGYEYDELKVIDDGGRRRVEKTRKQVPPDVNAQNFWLRNRQADRWKEHPEPEARSTDVGLIVDFLAVIRAEEALPALGPAADEIIIEQQPPAIEEGGTP